MTYNFAYRSAELLPIKRIDYKRTQTNVYKKKRALLRLILIELAQLGLSVPRFFPDFAVLERMSLFLSVSL
jgi:hypothetical protein